MIEIGVEMELEPAVHAGTLREYSQRGGDERGKGINHLCSSNLCLYYMCVVHAIMLTR